MFLQIKINGKTITECFRSWKRKKIREWYAKMIPPSKISVCWRDCDDMIYGWELSADQELDLIKVSALIGMTKAKKLEEILNAKGEKDENQKG